MQKTYREPVKAFLKELSGGPIKTVALGTDANAKVRGAARRAGYATVSGVGLSATWSITGEGSAFLKANAA